MKKLLFLLLLIPNSIYAQRVITGDITVSNSSCTATSCVRYQIPVNAAAVTVQLKGTFTGTFQFEATSIFPISSTDFVAFGGIPADGTAAVTSATAVGLWQFNVSGLSALQVRASATVTGTATVSFQPSNSLSHNRGSGGGGGGGGLTPGGSAAYAQYKIDGTTLGGNANVQINTSTGALELGRGHVTTTVLSTGGTATGLTFDGQVTGLVGGLTPIWKSVTNDGAGHGNFYGYMANDTPSNGSTRRDSSYRFGFNCDSAGVGYINTDQSFCWNLENDYITSQSVHQMEFYYTFEDPTHSFTSRPFSMTPNLDTDAMVARFSATSLNFTSNDGTKDDQIVINTNNSTINGGNIVFPYGRIFSQDINDLTIGTLRAGATFIIEAGTGGVDAIVTTPGTFRIDADNTILRAADQTTYANFSLSDGGHGAGLYITNVNGSGQPIYIVPQGSQNTYMFGTVRGYNAALKLGDSNGVTVNAAVATGILNVSGTVYLAGLSADTGVADSTLCKITATNQVATGTGTLGICLGTSSERFKHDIFPLNQGLNAILSLNPISYRYNEGIVDSGKTIKYGFTAERTLPILPDLVSLDEDGKPNTVDYMGIIPILVKAVQEQQKEIEELKR